MYHERGWSVIPLERGTKWPPPDGWTGRNGAIPSYADMHSFADQYPDGNLAIRLPRSVIGIDVDHYDNKRGSDTLAESERRWGKLPPTYRSTSRDDGKSGIRLYRIPEGVELVSRIEFGELDLGDIEICQYHHRYVVCWPSIHPDSRKTYQWIADNFAGDDENLAEMIASVGGVALMNQPPALGDIPDLPPEWLEALTVPARKGVEMAAGFNVDAPDVLTDGEPSSRVVRKLSWAMAELFRPVCRHDTMRDRVLGLLRCGKNGEPGVRSALNALCEAFVNRVQRDRVGGRKEAEKEFRRMVYGTDEDAKVRRFSASMLALLADTSYDDDETATTASDSAGGPRNDSEPSDFGVEDEPTTWEPVDLEPCLTGQKTQPEPTLGMYRSDGVQLIYPGREHVVLGDTESGKTWCALGCVRAELNRGCTVVYIHYEEPDETSTIERLLLLGVDPDVIRQRFRFVGPMRPVRKEWLQPLIDFKPSLVVHDGVNEAMSLHSNKQDVEGASTFRRKLVTPFTRTGVATLACDHVPMVKDGKRLDAYGTVHKGNVLDGTRIQLENFKPFGRGKRGVSNVFVTKDRPGFLRAHGKATDTPGKTFLGVLAVDDMTEQPDFLMKFYAPRELDDDITETADTDSASELAFLVWKVIYELPGHAVESLRKLYAEMRERKMQVREGDARNAVDDLTVQGRLQEVPGKRGATGYRVKPPALRLLPDVDYKKVFENEWDA
jgi:hypothetical protein